MPQIQNQTNIKKEEKTFFILFIKMTYLNTIENYSNFAIYKIICSTSYHMDWFIIWKL